VVCADGRIRVLRVRPADGGKITAADFVKSINLQTGIRLG
jgi:methionyl-tRNA formyltransferase